MHLDGISRAEDERGKQGLRRAPFTAGLKPIQTPRLRHDYFSFSMDDYREKELELRVLGRASVSILYFHLTSPT